MQGGLIRGDFFFHNKLHSNAIHRMRALFFAGIGFDLSISLTPRTQSH
jgi:hypothetical protein